jgi:hypothetical protein
MVTHVTDIQTVYGVDGVLFSMVQQGPVGALVTMTNSGTNTMNYHFQEFNGNAWNDLGALGTDLNNTLSGFQTKQVSVTSAFPQVRLSGYATGQTVLSFSVDRYVDRANGGSIPLLNL